MSRSSKDLLEEASSSRSIEEVAELVRVWLLDAANQSVLREAWAEADRQVSELTERTQFQDDRSMRLILGGVFEPGA